MVLDTQDKIERISRIKTLKFPIHVYLFIYLMLNGNLFV